MAHEHLVRDNDPFFSINADTREITYESKDKLVLIQGDHRSEVFTFTLPRYIDGHDMMDCNLVQVHFINIASSGGLRHSGLCQLTDLKVASEEDQDNLICTWLITNEATGYDGTLTFILRFACMNEDVVEYAWNTSIYSSVNILKSIYNSEEVVEQYIDILESWRKELIDSGLSGGIDSINAARDEAINRIANTGGVIVSETEPEQEDVDVWVNPASEEEFVNLLTDQDIAQELSDDPNKVPSVALLKQIAEQGGGGGSTDTGLTLDDIAYGGKTYREIFIDGNLIPDGNFENGLGFASSTAPANTAEITTEAYNSGSHSLKCFGNVSKQILIEKVQDDTVANCFVACKVRVDRYASGGGAGISLSHINRNLLLTEPTDGKFVTVGATYSTTTSKMVVFVGTISSADCDAYVDDLVHIDLTSVFGDDIPDQETMLALYDEYLAISANPTDDLTHRVEVLEEKVNALSGGTESGGSDDTGLTLDSVAYGGKTYREIFVDGNLIPDGNFENGLDFATVSNGSPEITSEVRNSKNHSLKCFGSSSTNAYVTVPTNQGNSFFTACKVRVDRYVAGGAGLQLTHIATNLHATEPTDGEFVTVGMTYTTANDVRVFFGTMSTADCDAYIDDLMHIDMTAIFGEDLPGQTTMLALYENYLMIVKSMETRSDTEILQGEVTELRGELDELQSETAEIQNEISKLQGELDETILDRVAYGGKTYREIFIDGNLIPDGNFENGLGFASSTAPANTAEITTEAYNSGSHSLKCFGDTSKYIQIQKPRDATTIYCFVACKVRVDRYVSGVGAGISVAHKNMNITLTEPTDGKFVTVGATYSTTTSKMVTYFGTFSSSSCDAYVDDVMHIDLTSVFGDDIPDQETMLALYDEYFVMTGGLAKRVEVLEEKVNALSNTTEYTPAECINAFVSEMNKKAATIGMVNSVFVNGSGTGTENLATARDLLKMVIEACNYNDILKIWGKKTRTITIEGANAGSIDLLRNTAQSVLEDDYYVFGGKTGSWQLTDLVQHNLVMVAEHKKSHKVFAGVILKATSADNRFVAMKELFDIANNKLTDSSFDTSTAVVANASCCIVCELPKYNTAMYQGYEPEILFEQNADTQNVLASVTKVMSLITGLDFIKSIKSKTELVSSDITDGSGNTHYAGDIMTIEDIIYSMMIPSCNTCATAFSRIAGEAILRYQE